MTDRRFAALIILDGWGLNPQTESNAVSLADTPTMDRLLAECPSTTLLTSGRSVGLPEGLMGNSEVGHLNLGAGRIVVQAVTQIDDRVRDGSFQRNSALLEALDRVAEGDGKLHLIGLVSDGGVHSWPNHYNRLIELAASRRLKGSQVLLHAFLDGRDTPPMSGLDHVEALIETLAQAGVGRVATLCGRYYSMDRDKRWERTQIAYDALTLGEGVVEEDPLAAIRKAYERGETMILKHFSGGAIGVHYH